MSSAKSAQLAGPEAVIGDFTTAWNTHDVEAYDRLFTPASPLMPQTAAAAVGIAVLVARFHGRGASPRGRG